MAAAGFIFAARLCNQAVMKVPMRVDSSTGKATRPRKCAPNGFPPDSTKKAMKKMTLTVPAKASKAREPDMALPPYASVALGDALIGWRHGAGREGNQQALARPDGARHRRCGGGFGCEA